MRLLNTRTYELKEFIGRDKPRYSILSHTWGDDEIIFEDIQGASSQEWMTKAGASKVINAAKLASSKGYRHIWIDTCCIDKRSSAELSEAINSMYKWYEQSGICFAFLSDISGANPYLLTMSRWFTRGWTLQELIAPKTVLFYDSDWVEIGSRQGLLEPISAKTGIDAGILSRAEDERERGPPPLDSFSISEKMLWAAGRHTKKVEDMAYCLMGIFKVNMPLLYGEGTRAFHRLQQEILRQSSGDHTMLLHTSRSKLLAVSPAAFDLGVRTFRHTSHAGQALSSIGLDNDAISIDVFVLTKKIESKGHSSPRVVTLGVLDCGFGPDPADLSRPLIVLNYEHGEHYVAFGSPIFVVKPDTENEATSIPRTRAFLHHPALGKDMNIPCSSPLCCQIEIDPIQFQRRRITIREQKFLRCDTNRPLRSLRLHPIPSLSDGKEYGLGFCYPPQANSIVSLRYPLWHLEEGIEIRALAALVPVHCKDPQERLATSFIFLLGMTGSAFMLQTSDAIWHRIIPMEHFLTVEEYSLLEGNAESNAMQVWGWREISQKLHDLRRHRPDIIPRHPADMRSMEIVAAGNGTKGFSSTLEKASFFGEELFDLKFKVMPASNQRHKQDNDAEEIGMRISLT